jgi:hypothetical protein
MIHCRNKLATTTGAPNTERTTAPQNIGANRSDDGPTIYFNFNLHAMNGCDLALAELSHRRVLLTLRPAIYRSR